MTGDEAASGQKYECTQPWYKVLGLLVEVRRCWKRRECSTCAELMSWDDEDWIRRGVDYWLSRGVSLVFLTLTLARPRPYREVSRMWSLVKQTLDRTVSGRPGYPGGLAFARVFERQEKRYRRTGETAVHVHAIIGGLQYRHDRLSAKPYRRGYLKAEQLGVDGAAVTKDELIKLAQRQGFGKMLDITQVQAAAQDPAGSYDVAHYLAKYLAKFEEIAQWLPKGAQVVAGSRGKFSWAGPGVTRQKVKTERLLRALERQAAQRETERQAQAAAQLEEPEEPEQLDLPVPWPPRQRRRRR